jgi:arginyl-tRNA--protein-N-Asp/Glu arginylyltransferase
MTFKAGFRPHERLTSMGWEPVPAS